MKAKLGIAPIAWWNDDLAELSDDVSLEECLRVASVFVGLGVNKLRITGGEPLVRKDVMWLIEREIFPRDAQPA